MNKKRKIQIVVGIIFLIALATGGGYFWGKSAGADNKSGIFLEKADANAEETIAVVNLDEGIAKSGAEKTYYADAVIEFPNDAYRYTSLEDARQGIENGNYGAYIIIPADFSQNVESLNATPNQAQIQYQISTKLSGVRQKEVLYQVLTFGENLNTDLSYMYLANILKEFHKAQDATGTVMSNDQKDKAAINEIQAFDLVKMVIVPELQKEENTIPEINIIPYMDTNRGYVQEIETHYKDNIADTKEQLEEMRQGGRVLADALGNLSNKTEEIELSKDENGENLYQSGLGEVGNTIDHYNASLLQTQSDGLHKKENLTFQKEQILAYLKNSVQQYNTQLSGNLSAVLENHKTDMCEAIPELTNEEVSGSNQTQYQVSCREVQGIGAVPILTFDIETEEEEELTKKKECAEEVLKALTAHKNADKKISDILEKCDEDEEFSEKLEECGYQDTEEVLQYLLDGDIEINTNRYYIKAEGDIEQLRQYLLSATDTVLSNGYQIPQYTDYAVDSQGQTISDENGNAVTVSRMLEKYDDFIGEMETALGEIHAIDTQGVTALIENQCVQPLVDRTESVKKAFCQRHNEEKKEIRTYQNMLQSYHPIMDMTNINECMQKMNDNATQFGKDFTENKEAYLQYTDRAYKNAQENTTVLLEHVNEAKEASDQAVTDGLASAKEIKSGTSAQNQSAMSDFSGKLPYTRLGTMEYTQTYEFIANPVHSTEVSDYEEVNVNSNQKADQATGKTGDWKQSKVVRNIVCILSVMITAGIVIGGIRHKKKTKVKLEYMGN